MIFKNKGEKRKRLEMYIGWTCEHQCLFCVEKPNMEKMGKIQVTKEEIAKKLLKYRGAGYTHVTFLGGEPFIQPNFLFSLKLAKILGYTTLVTTNARMLQIDQVAKRHLPFIDELILSIHTLNEETQKIMNCTTTPIDFNIVFQYITKYWRGSFWKINTVVTPMNIKQLDAIVRYIGRYPVTDYSITYPDIHPHYFSKEYITRNIALPYTKVVSAIEKILPEILKTNIRLKIVDIPFCYLPHDSWICYTDDYDYEERTKITEEGVEYNREGSGVKTDERSVFFHNTIESEHTCPRMRRNVDVCKKCRYLGICWGPAILYHTLFPLDKIKPIV